MMTTKYKDNFTEKVIIEIPKELICNKRKYKVIKQVIEVELFFEYCFIHNRITLKMPMFFFGAGSISQDINEICASMSDNETVAEKVGWADAEHNTYEIMIRKTLRSPFVSNIIKRVNSFPVKGG